MTIWLEIGGKQQKVELPAEAVAALRSGGAGSVGLVNCLVDGRLVPVDVSMMQPGVLSLIARGRQFRCVLDESAPGYGVVAGGRRHEFEVVDPRSLKGRRGSAAGADGPRMVKAPMPGRVVRVLVEVGHEVVEQQGVIVIEAMKMQNELKSPKAGRVARVAVAVGETVQQGAVLVIIE